MHARAGRKLGRQRIGLHRRALARQHQVRDVQAAVAAGCVPHLVLTGKAPPAQTDPLPPPFPVGTRVHADLAAFATTFIAEMQALDAARAETEAKARADKAPPPAAAH